MAAQATSWLVIVSNYQYGLDRNIYSHLYSLLEFYLTFYIKKRANEPLCSRSGCLFDFSVAKHDKSKCSCARCARAPVVKLIDLVCGFLVQPTSICTPSCTVDSVACPSKWSKWLTNLGIGWPSWPPILKTLFCPLISEDHPQGFLAFLDSQGLHCHTTMCILVVVFQGTASFRGVLGI